MEGSGQGFPSNQAEVGREGGEGILFLGGASFGLPPSRGAEQQGVSRAPYKNKEANRGAAGCSWRPRLTKGWASVGGLWESSFLRGRRPCSQVEGPRIQRASPCLEPFMLLQKGDSRPRQEERPHRSPSGMEQLGVPQKGKERALVLEHRCLGMKTVFVLLKKQIYFPKFS